MLSIANPLDPSCSSSKVLELGADEKVSEQLTLQKADLEVGLGETQTLHFSIRDYVFASRRKDISTNWPFPRQLMQLCLKHGIQDLLPPFQPPSALIAHCFSNPIVQVSHEARTNSPHIGETLLLDEEPNSIDLIPSCSAKVEDKPNELMHVEHEIGSAVTIHRDIEVIKPQLGEPVVNKCKLILKTQASRLEEFASSYLASEIMTPKVCPVCKMFSSTSNTTLNAHMDQCLSMESESTLVEDKNAKLRVKPRKKRLLEEIYATSTCCSLEDLDRRNGSSWVKDLTLVTPETENSDASIVEKKLQSSQLLTKDDKDEGAVYVDSNGVKLRILSKFDDAPRATSEAFEPMKNGKGIGDGSFISANNKHVGVMCSREMEMSQKNKKLSSSNLFKDKETLGVSYHEESQQKDGSPVLLSSMKDQYHMSFASATLRRWSCSKRSNLSKKNTQKDLSKSLENSKLVHQMAKVDSRKTACSTSSAAECHPTELSESPNSKFVHIPLNTIQNKENHEKGSQRSSLEVTSRNILLLQLPKASAGNMKSCMRKRETKPQDSCGISRTLTGTSHFPQKTKRVSTLSNAKSNIRLLHDNLQLVQTDKRKREFSFKGNGEQPRCGEADLLEFPMEEVVTQSLHAGSSMCQDCEPKDSNKPFENMTSVSAFLRKAEDSSIITGSAGSDDHGILLDSYDEEGATNATDGYSIPVEEVSQDKPGEQTTKLEHRDVESQDQATSAQELSVNIVSPTDQGTCFPRESSSTASHPVSPVEKHDPVISREPFVSASIASTISPAFLMDSKCEATRSKPVSRSPTINRHLNLPLPSIISKEGTQEIEIGLSQQVQNDFAERKTAATFELSALPLCLARPSNWKVTKFEVKDVSKSPC
ncbi:hypothetical protein HPP92_015268 [Vanilla planifolia]|uniref:Uncharacterized protein n=1 Tax=Vanilla planifolia TaxID=51239 RepID=A0A835UVJ3_VANPL|nr:hypothetical protein HPP92_015268 [Vanilla planifolia]